MRVYLIFTGPYGRREKTIQPYERAEFTVKLWAKHRWYLIGYYFVP